MKTTAALAVVASILCAGLTAGSPGAAESPVQIISFAGGYPPGDLDEAIDNLQCVLGFTSLARYHDRGMRGFAARLPDTQLARLEDSTLVRQPLRDQGEFLLNLADTDPNAADARMSELADRIGFSIDVRFHRPGPEGWGAFQGWGASLDWRQLLLLDFEPDVTLVTPNGSDYIVFFAHLDGDAVPPRADVLGRKYGFSVEWVYANMFGARLSNEQLAGLSSESDLAGYTLGEDESFGILPPARPMCLHASRKTRHELAKAFNRKHSRVMTDGPSGRVWYARLTAYRDEVRHAIVTEHALAAFRLGNERKLVTEVFWRRPDGRWLDLRPLGAKICSGKVPEPVLAMWLFRPVRPAGCYARD